MEASFMRSHNVFGNVTMTNILTTEFIKGRQDNLTLEEEIIVDDFKWNLEMESGYTLLDWTKQRCENLFISATFRGKYLTWSSMKEFHLGPKPYPTDFGACCWLTPHLDLEPDDNFTIDMYHELKADALNGKTNGLDILLDAEQFNYADHNSGGVGFKIALHHHLDKPMIEFSSQLIPTGTNTQINLKPTISYLTEFAISRFSADERGCYADNEVNLTYLTRDQGFRYEMNNCLIDQGIRNIIWNCRCLPFYFYEGMEAYLPIIGPCSGINLYCANKGLQSFGLEFSNNKENDTIVPEALESPNMMGNETNFIKKPDPIKCIASCKLQDNNSQMSFVPYPQIGNFFHQKAFCDVASHIWQETCQKPDRAYFMNRDQPLLCPILQDFVEYFNGKAKSKTNHVDYTEDGEDCITKCDWSDGPKNYIMECQNETKLWKPCVPFKCKLLFL